MCAAFRLLHTLCWGQVCQKPSLSSTLGMQTVLNLENPGLSAKHYLSKVPIDAVKHPTWESLLGVPGSSTHDNFCLCRQIISLFCFTAQPSASQSPHCIHISLHTDSHLEQSKQFPWRENLSTEEKIACSKICTVQIQASSHQPPQVLLLGPILRSLPGAVHLGLQLYFLEQILALQLQSFPLARHANSKPQFICNKEVRVGCRACDNTLRYDTESATGKLPSFQALFVPLLLRPPV